MEERVGAANGGEAIAAQMAEMALQERSSEEPLFSFGVITDIQYADIDDGRSFLGVPRYYRHALVGLRRAVEAWNKKGNLAFAIHFGDIVDGYCPREQSRAAFKTVISEMANFHTGQVYHIIGNHCLYNLPRQDLNELLTIPTSGQESYYSFSPHPGFLFVILDGSDVSALGWLADHPHTTAARELLNARNPNEEKNSPEGLEGVERRFVKFNGGVGDEQLAWLERTLQAATDAKQKVVICCHLPLDPGAAAPATLLWNFDLVMGIVHKFHCVVACLGGHAHEGGHAVDSHGVHHHVLEAVLECPPGTDAYGYIDVYRDHLSLHGTDRMESTDMFFL
jgi:manganese-dependent ADP-ribose/CDP-alcohol diphosphatase